MSVRYTIKNMQEWAASRGGKCLSKEYWGMERKLVWMCWRGHTWDASPYKIQQGIWCPACLKNKKKYTIGDMHELAKKRGFKCLSDTYVNSHARLKWQCSKGHIWMAAPVWVKSGTGCPYCAGVAKGTIDKMQRMAEEKGGKCLSKKYINSATKLKWQCSKGHSWKAVPNNIQQGAWCPQCIGRKRYDLKQMRGLAANKGGKCLSTIYTNGATKLKWQCAEGHIWKTMPAVIVAGKWCPTCAHIKNALNSRNSIEEMQKMAEAKGGKCLSEKYVNNHTKLKWQCSKGHLWKAKPNTILRGAWCPDCSGKKRLDIKQMNKWAEGKGGKCLSTVYINNRTKLKWQCKAGHIWKTTPGLIRIGRWCPICAHIKIGLNSRHTIEEMQKMAKKRGGKCLSKEYVNRTSHLTWQCAKEHTWHATPLSVRHHETWCPECARLKRGKIKNVKMITEEKEK